ncbi:MAG: hypothetical protein JWN67_421 [Actinomycetia bacterium]|nr:hypothetical protein [Actinomycetes bacterium]
MAAVKKAALRVVSAGEKAQRRRHTVTSAAADGDRLDLLLAMRARVAKAVQDESTPARDLAALTRRLLEIAKDIEILQAAAEEEAEDGAPAINRLPPEVRAGGVGNSSTQRTVTTRVRSLLSRPNFPLRTCTRR